MAFVGACVQSKGAIDSIGREMWCVICRWSQSVFWRNELVASCDIISILGFYTSFRTQSSISFNCVLV